MEKETDVVQTVPDDTLINGLTLLNEVITEEEAKDIVKEIDSDSWDEEIWSRRVKNFGYTYSYRKKGVDLTINTRPVPPWLKNLIDKIILLDQIKPFVPDQVIVNEYLAGQGIKPHIDSVTDWAECIISLSLLSGVKMGFTNITTHKKIHKYLNPRSLLILKEDARYQWKHSIELKTSDLIDGKEIPRSRRVSITFRKYEPKND